jgi:low temperature requirement protein LtrA
MNPKNNIIILGIIALVIVTSLFFIKEGIYTIIALTTLFIIASVMFLIPKRTLENLK